MTSGWKLEPGTEAGEGIIVICELLLHSNDTKIPAVVIEDEECLIFALRQKEGGKVLLNIRYKNIDGFVPEKHMIVIKLKGVQQIVVEPCGKEAITKFKEYLVKWRDRSRQKQLTFIRHYINLYSQDVANIIHKIGEEDVRGGKEEQFILSTDECPIQTQKQPQNEQAELSKEKQHQNDEVVLEPPQFQNEKDRQEQEDQIGQKQEGKSEAQDGGRQEEDREEEKQNEIEKEGD